MEKDYLILKRASASRLSGEGNEDDFDVLCDGVVRWPDHEDGRCASWHVVDVDAGLWLS